MLLRRDQDIGTNWPFLTDLSKAFDCINHPLLIAKFYNYGLSHLCIKIFFPIWAIGHIEPKWMNASVIDLE